jgi:hypothetical protein
MRSGILEAVDEGPIAEGITKMFGYDGGVMMMVGKAIDADRLAVAKRERLLNEEKRTRRFPRRTR